MRRSIAIGVIAAVGLTGCAGGGASTAPSPIASSTPTVVVISASDDMKFSPAQIAVKPGAAVTFTVTNAGKVPHAFMVGPKDAVDTDSDQGTALIKDIGVGETKEISFTFGTTGSYAFACHVPGHFEAGMKGSIALAP